MSTSSLRDQLSYLRKACKLTKYDLRVEGEHTLLSVSGSEMVLKISEEEVSPGNPLEYVHRVVLAGDDVPYKAGWVVDSDASKCMHCHSARFNGFSGLFNFKHHCRMCGNVVCGSCSNKRIDLEKKYSLNESGKSRVCKTCFTLHKDQDKAAAEVAIKSGKAMSDSALKNSKYKSSQVAINHDKENVTNNATSGHVAATASSMSSSLGSLGPLWEVPRPLACPSLQRSSRHLPPTQRQMPGEVGKRRAMAMVTM